jgi:acylphosphatase
MFQIVLNYFLDFENIYSLQFLLSREYKDSLNMPPALVWSGLPAPGFFVDFTTGLWNKYYMVKCVLLLIFSIGSCSVMQNRGEMSSKHVKITGVVQGVGYRAWAYNEAKNLNLTGWVKNNDDGSVEGVFQGKKANLEEMMRKLKDGPDYAEVKNVAVISEGNSSSYPDFRIKD